MTINAVREISVSEQREKFGEYFPGVVEPPQSPGSIGRRRGAQDEMTAARMEKLVSEYSRARQVGMMPATILNLSPLQLRGPGVLNSHIVIEPCPRGKLYTRYVIPAPTTIGDMSVSWRDERDDNWSPVIQYPIQLARDFEQQYWSKGGVVVFQGDHDPAEDSKAMAAIADSKARMIGYGREKWRDAMHQWNSPNRSGARNIDVMHRAYAQLLIDEGVFSDIPPWFDATPETKGLGEKCPRCQTAPHAGAYMCPSCAFILDPRVAYENMEIDETHTALQRLSRDVLNELGISAMVVETQEERKARIASRGLAPIITAEPDIDDSDDDDEDLPVAAETPGAPQMTKAERRAARRAAKAANQT